MGSVWRARDEVLERDVALKALPRHVVVDPAAERRFEREARAMGRLQHPNVVGIYDIGRGDPGTGGEIPFLVMELVRGRPLHDVIAAGRPGVGEVLRWMEQVARALAEAHAAGIVHRDLKPSNIMVDETGHVVVLDFGLARLTRQDGEVTEETLTTPGMVLGSCPYMAPEQALGREVTPASDLFAFGAVLYEALTGTRAFHGDTPMRVLQAVVRSERVPMEDLAPGLPTAVVEIVDRCLERDSSRRYPSAGALAADLAAAGAIEASSPSGVLTTVVSHGPEVVASVLRRRRRRRGFAGAVAVGLVAGTAAGLWFGRRGYEPIRPDPGRWTMTELYRGSGDLDRPAWSPGGDSLAVARTEGDTGVVVVVPVSGDDPRVLVRGGSHEVPSRPSFSPEAAAVAVSVISGSSQSVHVVPAVGGPPAYEIENALHGVWLDRSTLAFSRLVDGRSAIWTVELETGREGLLVDERDGLSWWEVVPRPGGGLALVGGATDIDPGIFVSDAAGDRVDQWLAPGRKVQGADWAPGGAVLVASVDGQLVKLDGTRVSPLLPDSDEVFQFPAFSDDGRLAAVQNRRTYDIISVDPDGGGWECLVCDRPRSGWGSAGSDGSVVYRLTVGDSSRVYLRAPGIEARALTTPDEMASCPVMSPDAIRVAYLARVEGSTELRVRPRSGGDPVTLARDVESSELVAWSPDGRSIAYAGGRPLQVFVVSTAGGTPRAVSPSGGDYPSWSPDGRLIAFAVWNEASDPAQGTWVVASGGGEPRKVGEAPTRAVWDPVTGELLQLRRSADGAVLELWSADSGRWRWRRRAELDIGVRPPIQIEYLPLSTDWRTGRLVMNRRSGTGRLVVFDGIEPERWER